MTSYVLDNAAGQASQRFSALEVCLDPATTRHLATIGVGSSWCCLEVGGGGGSIGRWLSAQVGDSGSVLVTDIDPRWMDGVRDGNLEEKMVATGDVTAADLDAFRSVLKDPGVAFNSYLTVSAWGRRPLS